MFLIVFFLTVWCISHRLRTKISNALPELVIGPMMYGTFSHNYKIGSVETNMIFEGSSYLPKEVMLEMTLKAFGYDIDMMEVITSNHKPETIVCCFVVVGFFCCSC